MSAPSNPPATNSEPHVAAVPVDPASSGLKLKTGGRFKDVLVLAENEAVTEVLGGNGSSSPG